MGPDVCLTRNPKLVYGRMTGWGQDGPLAKAAGHDINYIAVSGALGAIGTADSGPVPPLNLVGDFGGGAMLLAFGVACALIEAARSGRGQVVDAAMVDGSALLMSMFFGMDSEGSWFGRGHNALGGGAHYYGAYRCADGEWISIGSIEPQFYALLLRALGIQDPEAWPQHDRTRWPAMKAALAERFATKTRAEWCALMEGSDICFAPVLSLTGDETSALGGARHFRRNRRSRAAGARAAFQPQQDGTPLPARRPRRAHRGLAGRTRLRPRRHRRLQDLRSDLSRMTAAL